MRWLKLKRNFGKTRALRLAARKTAGGITSLLGAAIIVATMPVWIWKFLLGAGLTWLGAVLFSVRD
ncbi:MAG: hypothetical protein ACOX8W_12385 [bacterium]|jgi:hypothetical protein